MRTSSFTFFGLFNVSFLHEWKGESIVTIEDSNDKHRIVMLFESKDSLKSLDRSAMGGRLLPPLFWGCA